MTLSAGRTEGAGSDGGAPRAVDVVVTVPEGAAFSTVAAGLRQALGRAPEGPEPWTCVGEPVPGAAVLGLPPLLQGATLSLGEVSVPAAVRSLLEIRVVGGPDAGAAVPLRPGSLVVGRAAGCDLRLDDPVLSRRHLVATLGEEGCTVREAGSANGSQVGEDPVPLSGCSWPVGTLLRCGSSTLVLAEVRHRASAVRPDGRGHLVHNRMPQLTVTPATGDAVQDPPEVAPWRMGALSASALVAPLVTAAVLLAVGVRGSMLAFVVVSPVVGLATGGLGALPAWRRRRRQRRDRAEALRTAASALCQQLDEERGRRRDASPDLAEVVSRAVERTTQLYQRGQDDEHALEIRWGSGPAWSEVAANALDETLTLAGVDRRTCDRDAPVSSSLRHHPVTGVAGPRAAVTSVARSAALQLATLHPPEELWLAAACEPSAATAWEWLRWLPHHHAELDGTAAVEALVAERLAHRSGGWIGPAVVVLVEGVRSLRDSGLLAVALDRGREVGVHLLCLADDVLDLPAQCTATVVLDGPAASELRVTCSASRTNGRPDGASPSRTEDVARRLAPVVTGPAHRTALPDDLTLLDLQPLSNRFADGSLDPSAIARGWQAGDGRASAVIGVGADGPLRVDLDDDGPHALVAGTTGSGKSETLRTLVSSLALGSSPADLAFVLVDYKGGSAFAGCAELPHTAAVVTDLDPGEARRALASLTAELRRRERVLAAVGARDLTEYRAMTARAGGRAGGAARSGRGTRGAADSTPLPEQVPRLVIVVDEFAALRDELPDFVPGLVGLAQRGRSLGIHLVLATQRPSGAVSADIRANASLVIALRLSAEESREVLNDPAAATIAASSPGRAVVSTSSGPRMVQVARLDPSGPKPTHRVTLAGEERDVKVERDGELHAVVAATRAAAALLGLPAAARPWLPPLPSCVRLDALLGSRDLGPEADVSSGDPRASHAAPVYALVDEPELQRRSMLSLDLSGGCSLAVVGGARSGRTTTLRTVAGTGIASHSPDALHVHVLDGTGELLALDGLPHVGTVVGTGDLHRAERLLVHLSENVSRARRSDALARASGTTAAGARAHPGAAAETGATPKATLLLVDGWEAWCAATEAAAGSPVMELLHALLLDGPGGGLSVVVTGGRALLSGRAGAAMQDRLLLPPYEHTAVALAGLRPADLPGRPATGRAVLSDGREAQVAVLTDEATAAADAVWLSDASRRWGAPAGLPPLRLRALPESLDAAELPPAPSAHQLVVGVGDDQTQPPTLDLRTGPLLVAGPARSGRTTALRTLAAALVAGGREVAVVTARPREWASVQGVSAVIDPTAALPIPVGCGAVLVDDVEQITDMSAQESLRRLIVGGSQDVEGPAVVLAGSSEALVTSFAPAISALRRRRPDGVLLTPRHSTDGEVFGLRVRPGPVGMPPGRGLLIRNGTCTPVQVARHHSAEAAVPGQAPLAPGTAWAPPGAAPVSPGARTLSVVTSARRAA